MNNNIGQEIWEWVKAIAIAAILAVLLRTFVFEQFVVDGNSMQPTLYDGERVFVSKLVYHFRSPKRGEIIVFRYPSDPSRDFIKRVIGLPGDTVRIETGKVYVNGVPLDEPYLQVSTQGQYSTGGKVPEGTVFVLGDNRNFSLDSRDPSVGFVRIELIKGKASAVVWPPSRWRLLR